MIQLDDKHFMMIEPGSVSRDVAQDPEAREAIKKLAKSEAINDEMTSMAIRVMARAVIKPGYAYKGFHICSCGELSDNHDWVMPDGRITNSLVVHYVQCHRSEIPRSEIAKLLCYAKELL